MIVFRRKEFSIPEGHYTGPKDMDKVPGVVEMATKGALAGTAVGAIVGGLSENGQILDDAITGAKYGTLTGIVAKFFLNYLHKPMNRVKYQEVDKAIRRQFGVYQIQGITIGDSVSKRANINEKFEFNDRDVSKYKINFAIHDNTVTMYTFGLSKEEFEKVDKTLDYYCKKYAKMEYSSRAINPKVYSYGVDITFTNYQVICNFIMEMSELLGTKINLLDNNAIVTSRLQEASEEIKTFSVSDLNKYDLMKILTSGLGKGIASFQKGGKQMALKAIKTVIEGVANKFKDDELIRLGFPKPIARKSFNNKFLEDTLKKLHYIEGFNYSTGDIDCDIQLGLASGLLVISVSKDCENLEDIDNAIKKLMIKSDTGKVVLYTYTMKNRNEFEFIIKKFMGTGIKPNIFEK